MVTQESLQEAYAKFDTIDLLEIVANKNGYTELAVSVALAELRKRNVTNDEIRNYKSVFPQQNDELLVKNYLTDLNLFQKIIFYILWIPRIRSFFTMDFQSDGYVLKSQQSNYYSILGFVFCFLALATSQYPNQTYIAVWCGGFIASYLFDICFNRDKQITDLQKRLEDGKSMWGI
nr:hypothetical protein [Mucilaginibacter sp. L294]